MSRRTISRREFLKIGGASLAGATLLGGCGGGGGDNGLVFSWGPELTGTLQEMVDRFNQENEDGINVTYREMPSDTGQYFDRLRTEFQAGGGDIDVIGSDVIWPAQFAAQGWLLDLSDRFPKSEQSDFLDAPIESNTYDGKPFGVPWYMDSGMLYYRQDLLEEAGFSEPPATWDELKEMAERIKQDEGVQYGFVFQGSDYEGGVCNLCEYVWTHGGDLLDPDDPSRVIVDSPESAASFATARGMIADGISPQSVTTFTEQESQTTFLNGDAVFMRNWPYIYGLAANEDESRVRQEQLSVAPIPAGGPDNDTFSTLGGWNFSINAATDNPDAAWTFIQWMTAPEQLKEFALKTARIPPRQELLEDQEILDTLPVVRLGKEAIDRTRPRPVSPFYSDLSLEMSEVFTTNLRGDVEPEQAVANLQSEMEEIIEQGQQMN
ncbi:MAG: ABC transporter substrate-binding protein [Rubrobacteraceae bacterium]